MKINIIAISILLFFISGCVAPRVGTPDSTPIVETYTMEKSTVNTAIVQLTSTSTPALFNLSEFNAANVVDDLAVNNITGI